MYYNVIVGACANWKGLYWRALQTQRLKTGDVVTRGAGIRMWKGRVMVDLTGQELTKSLNNRPEDDLLLQDVVAPSFHHGVDGKCHDGQLDVIGQHCSTLYHWLQHLSNSMLCIRAGLEGPT